ncbi:MULTISPECIES: hypothetical protein [unclassified Streptomyces]|uniref:hypothetical protein n=1 Tax=unclassified Streptomyces TaxID=2593676 RepID=UPI002E2C0EDA|nr:hypothetical protein [Streptomyces sp. NBC_00272]
MTTRRLSAALGVLLLAALAPAGPAPAAVAAAAGSGHAARTPAQYLYSSIGDFDSQVKPLIDRPDIAGVQVVVPWKALEPQKDRYDFSAIEEALTCLRARHKKLFVQVQDRFFSAPTRLPNYLLTDPEYAGGAAPTTNENGLGPGEPGAVAAQWNPEVRHRFQSLLKALADRFDGRLAGVNLPETATQVDLSKDRTGYTDESYFRAELDNMAFGAKVFKRTQFIQYVNFWPGEWNNDHGYMEKTFEFAKANGVGLGGPDVLPNRQAQMENSYPFFERYRGLLPLVAMAVQEPDFEYTNPSTGKPYTKEEFVDFGGRRLGADVMFWATSAPWLHSR